MLELYAAREKDTDTDMAENCAFTSCAYFFGVEKQIHAFISNYNSPKIIIFCNINQIHHVIH